MNYIEAVLLAIVQGLTEFLPLSSSAHLILLSDYLGSNQNLFYDVSLHLGTLLAVCFYFRQDLISIVTSIVEDKSLFKNQLSTNLIIASIPTLLLGFILIDFIDLYLRTSEVIAFTTIIFGLVLFFATFKPSAKKDLDDISSFDALIIGLSQVFALIPGTSRSGVTISAGLFLGLDNKTASKFSFLLAIPTIGAIAAYQLVTVDVEYLIEYAQFNLLGITISFLIAYGTIEFFIKFINKIGFMPFIIYRIILGLILIYFLF